MYIYVKLPLGNLNPSAYPPHLTSAYTCGLTITLKLCGGARAGHLKTYKHIFKLTLKKHKTLGS